MNACVMERCSRWRDEGRGANGERQVSDTRCLLEDEDEDGRDAARHARTGKVQYSQAVTLSTSRDAEKAVGVADDAAGSRRRQRE